ncbi:MAG: hypothetical protein H6718_03855 [Polyangiaceae bacterium]|nr:hypothetical protein [Polyangiaceae bacterium]MCB9609345.1 hypothetical protein [Polyangiaceae bacterium]
MIFNRHGLALLASLLCGCSCSEPSAERAAPPQNTGGAQTAPPPRALTPKPEVRVVSLDVPDDLPVFALQGGNEEGVVGVVLHGHCGHGLGYLQAFQFAAAKYGRFIALQGDRPCDGALRSWSADPVRVDARIRRSLTIYLGHPPPERILAVGSSLGAVVAIALSKKFPQRYDRLVLNSLFRQQSGSGLAGARVWFFAGEHENTWPARLTAESWERAGVTTRFRSIESAGHSDFHGQGDRLMREAFAFVTNDAEF